VIVSVSTLPLCDYYTATINTLEQSLHLQGHHNDQPSIIYSIPQSTMFSTPQSTWSSTPQSAKDNWIKVSYKIGCSSPRKDAEIITLSKPGKDSKFPPNLRPISLLSTTGKLFKKVIITIVKRHIDEKGLLNTGQFGFRVSHSTTLQCMRLTDHVTLNFNNMSTAAVFLDIEKAFDTKWHNGLLYKLSKMNFPASLIKLIFFRIENFLFLWKEKCLRQG
jgi:hypothetical protein